jgi:hypothetical protein
MVRGGFSGFDGAAGTERAYPCGQSARYPQGTARRPSDVARFPTVDTSTIGRAPFRGSIAVAHGLLTARQLAGPRFRRMFRDVYVSACATVDHMTRCQAAALLLPADAALSHETAAMFYNVPPFVPGRRRAHLSVPPGCRPTRSEHLIVHRVRLEPAEITHRSGLPVTSPERTAFDLGSDRDPVAAVVALDALLYQRIVKPAALISIADMRMGWPGARRFRHAISLARPHVESPMETRTRMCLVGAGLPEPTIQYTVVDSRGHFVARLDLAYERLRIGLEYDGDHHRERDTFRRDAVRLNRLRLLGWTILRFTADDVLRFPERLIAQVTAARKIATNGKI